MAKIKWLFNETLGRLNSLEGSLLRYALSATLLLALPSCLISAVVLFAQEEDYLYQMLQVLSRFLPEELIVQVFDYFLQEEGLHRPLIVSLGVSVALASKSVMHFMLLGKKEHQSQIPFWMLRILSIVLMIQLGGLVIAQAVLIRVFHLNVMVSMEMTLFCMLMMFYRGVSLRRSSWYDEIAGTAIAWSGLHGIALFFFFYIRTIASTDLIYGPLSTIVIVFLSSFAVSNVLYLGYSMNEVLRQHRCCRPHYPKAEKMGERIWKF